MCDNELADLARPHCDDLSRNHANSFGSSCRDSILHERSPLIYSNVYDLALGGLPTTRQVPNDSVL